METEYDLELESNLAATVRTSASVHGVHTLPAELRDLRLLILPLLGPEGVIIMISDLEVQQTFGHPILNSKERHIAGCIGGTKLYRNIHLSIIHAAM